MYCIAHFVRQIAASTMTSKIDEFTETQEYTHDSDLREQALMDEVKEKFYIFCINSKLHLVYIIEKTM